MSLQWTLIAGFLYAEIVFVVFLLLPFISPSRWNKVIKSRFISSIAAQSNLYFYIFIAILVLFFLDAIREINKYTGEQEETHVHLDTELQVNLRLFRAQRNFYISGFALFLWLVIKRLVTLISAHGLLEAKCAAAMKQAESASRAAQNLLDRPEETGGDNAALSQLQESVDKKNEELTSMRNDLESMKSQAKSVSSEYDRLLSEHEKLQRKVEQGGDKKDD